VHKEENTSEKSPVMRAKEKYITEKSPVVCAQNENTFLKKTLP